MDAAPAAPGVPPGRRPADDEIDVFGLTHQGYVRTRNDDHFLICSLHKTMRIRATSLPSLEGLPREGERLAFLGMVADGVGGQPAGHEASRVAVESLTRYVAGSLHCYQTRDPAGEPAFLRALEDAVLEAHTQVLAAAAAKQLGQIATTLTLLLAVWPRAFVVQVGDSRCYQLRDGTLRRITRDQTLAEALVDEGSLRRSQAELTRFAHLLTSAVGGSDIVPVVSAIDVGWQDVLLLCSDGLTKHVADDEIAERLREMTSAEQVTRDLVATALARGGTDNVTVLVGRAVDRV
jgi:serine/threonine protein phosphatase PrpC